MIAISEVAERINERAGIYEIGRLQQLRKQIKGMKSAQSVIFNTLRASVNDAEGWAFHTGGREELQFNIGIDADPHRFRFGVAFSLEPSRSLTSISPLLPKIERFNEYVRNNGANFESFRMWISRGSEIVKRDTAVRQISEDEIEIPNFIFCGRAVPVSSLNIDEVLRAFDELLPLYCFVESTNGSGSFVPPDGYPPFDFRERITLDDRDASLRSPQGEIGVVLRSKQIKRKLFSQLRKEAQIKLGDEISSGNGGKIDLVRRLPSGEYDFYEIKPAILARHAIREALPQLLEYTYRRGGKEARRLIIVSQAALDRDSEDFLSALRGKGIPIYYKHVPLN